MSSKNIAYPSILLPFTFFFQTRVKNLPVLGYIFLNELLPVLLLGYYIGSYHSLELILFWILSYLAFISIYEIGYYLNDVYSIVGEGALARKRLPAKLNNIQLSFWLLIRIFTWAGISFWILPTELREKWMYFYLFLILSFTLHNVLNESYRSSTFICLAFFRYFSCGLIILPSEIIVQVFPGVFLCYMVPRLWAYQESKGMLSLKDRRDNQFRMSYLLIVTFIALFIFLSNQSITHILPSIYYLVLGIIITVTNLSGVPNNNRK